MQIGCRFLFVWGRSVLSQSRRLRESLVSGRAWRGLTLERLESEAANVASFRQKKAADTGLLPFLLDFMKSKRALTETNCDFLDSKSDLAVF